jgi:hypothetical protein
VSPSIRIDCAPPATEARASIAEPAANTGLNPGAARRSSEPCVVMSSSIGPFVAISTVSSGSAASTHACSVPLQGGEASGQV